MGVMEVQIIQMSNVLFTVTSWIQTNLAAEPVNGKHAVPEEVLFVWTAGTLVLDGSIKADGNNPKKGQYTSGVSGGGVKISVDNISGSGFHYF